MKIEKLPSGSYRIRKTYKGKLYTVMFDCKPTQKEAVQAMSKALDRVQEKRTRIDFQAAASEYIETKRNVLSPATIRGYKSYMGSLSKNFKVKNIHDITVLDIQAEVNQLSKEHSPKTVRNYHGFISAVLGAFRPEMKIYTTLPQKVKTDPYIPSGEDIRKILECAGGTEFEVPIMLACYGMRRSEICALKPEDIDGDVVHINKAMVQNENKEWVIKSTKTAASRRDIIVPVELADKIRRQGYVYKGHPNSITQFLERVERRLDIPDFSVHKLRHYFASQMSSLGVPEADVMRLGGWETDHVMKSVYRHSMMDKDSDAKRAASEKLRNVLFD